MAEAPEAGGIESQSAWEQAAERSFAFLFVLVAVLALGWGLSNCRQVPPDSRVIVLRFGTVVREAGAGLLLALPRPFEQLMVLPSADRQIEFKMSAFQTAPASPAFPPPQSTSSPVGTGAFISPDPRANAGMLLTGDMSVVHFAASLLYQITDAKAYVLASEHVAPALERVFSASAVAVVARRDLDTILVARPDRNAGSDAPRAGRERLRADLLAEVNRRLADLDRQGGSLGITVTRIDLVPSLPLEAKPAFDSVLLALQRAETAIAEAHTRAETRTQRANQDRDRLLTDAQAMAEERTTQAQERTAAISALALNSQGLSGAMLSNQLYQEKVGQLLGQAGRVFAADGAGGARLILPAGSSP